MPHEPEALEALKIINRKAADFDEADIDGDQQIDYEEFCLYVMPIVEGVDYTKKDLKEWWGLLDIDGDGEITKDEFFMYALCAGARRAGAGVESIFKTFDVDKSGLLDELEFSKAMDDMGFGDVADVIFRTHKQGRVNQQVVSYIKLLQTIEQKVKAPEMRRFLKALATDTFIQIDTSTWQFGGETVEQAREGLVALLRKHRVKLADLFQQLDDDGSFSLKLEEFLEAMWELGFNGPSHVPKEIWKVLDSDESGQIRFDELQEWVYGKGDGLSVAERRAKQAMNMDLKGKLQASMDDGDEEWDASRLQAEIHNLLYDNGLLSIDLVRAWDRGSKSDVSGDSQVTKHEYAVSLKKMVDDEDLWYSHCRKAAIKAFSIMDASGDGAVSLSELCKWIDPHNRLLSNSRKIRAQANAEKHASTPEKRAMLMRQSTMQGVDTGNPFEKKKEKKRAQPLWAPRVPPPPPVYVWKVNGVTKPAFNASRTDTKWSPKTARVHLKGTAVQYIAPPSPPPRGGGEMYDTAELQSLDSPGSLNTPTRSIVPPSTPPSKGSSPRVVAITDRPTSPGKRSAWSGSRAGERSPSRSARSSKASSATIGGTFVVLRDGASKTRARLAAQTAYSDATAKRAFPSPASLGFKIDAMDLSRLRDSARPGPSDERAAVIAVHLRNSIRAAAVQVPKRRPPRFGPNYRPAPALRVLSGGACATTQGQVHRGDAVIEARNTRPQSARAEQPSQYRRSELESSTATLADEIRPALAWNGFHGDYGAVGHSPQLRRVWEQFA